MMMIVIIIIIIIIVVLMPLVYSVDVRFEVFTAVTMKNGVFWVVTPYGSWYFFAAYVGC
jgi:hypothetical protein